MLWLSYLSVQGQRFKDQIVRAMQNNTFFTSKVLPYNKTQDGAALYAGYLHSAESLYSQYVEEIRGMADGAKIAFDEVQHGYSSTITCKQALN